MYISTLPHSCTVVKQYKELTTKILSITFLILAFLTIHLGDHGVVNVLINLLVISHLIKLLHPCLEVLLHGLLRESYLCLEGLLHGLLRESVHHLRLRLYSNTYTFLHYSRITVCFVDFQ